MQSKLLNENHGQRTFAVIFQTGDEVIGGLTDFAKHQQLSGSQLTAIGAFSDVVLAYFDWATREYQKIPVLEQVEVLTLAGDISSDENGKPKVHAHVVVGLRDGSTRGGHLMEAHVRPTLEVILTESPRHLQREFDPASGLGLIDLSRSHEPLD
jgi:predicted DNA-binding protein with PD1-like motif